jgi:hypothetical protein
MNSEEEIYNKIYVKSYSKIGLYIYYEGCDIEVLNYIKEFQDHLQIGSQVVISTKEVYESVGIHNCFKTEDIPTNWTNFSLTRPVKCLRIKEKPRKSVQDLDEFEDDLLKSPTQTVKFTKKK